MHIPSRHGLSWQSRSVGFFKCDRARTLNETIERSKAYIKTLLLDLTKGVSLNLCKTAMVNETRERFTITQERTTHVKGSSHLMNTSITGMHFVLSRLEVSPEGQREHCMALTCCEIASLSHLRHDQQHSGKFSLGIICSPVKIQQF